MSEDETERGGEPAAEPVRTETAVAGHGAVDGEPAATAESAAAAAAPAAPAAAAAAADSAPVGLAVPVAAVEPVAPEVVEPAAAVVPVRVVPAVAAPAAVAPAAVAAAAVEPAAAAVKGKRPLVKRHHGLVRFTHWANAVLLLGMIASGLQIYAAFTHFGQRGGPYLPNPFDGKPFPAWAALGGWLGGGLLWHFFLAWPFVLTGVAYLAYLALSGEWRSLLFRPSDVPRAVQMQLYYLHLRKEHPPQGKHNALQKAAYSFIVTLGAISVLSGFAIYKTVQLWWLTRLFGGYQGARYVHFWAVFLFVGFVLVHVSLVFLVDPASLRAMVTGWYRGRFPSHD